MSHFIKSLCISVTTGFVLMLVGPSTGAAPGPLADIPIFATTNAPPNIVLVIDDSGSMDSEVLFFTNDAALWWNTASPNWSANAPPEMMTRGQTYIGVDGPYGTPILGGPSFNIGGSANSTWKKYVYLFPNGTGTGNRVYSDSTNDHFAVPPLAQYAFARSPQYNASYYDPSITYTHWPSYGSTTYADISANAAPSDPTSGSGTLNLTQNRYSTDSNQTFKMFRGMVVPKGTYSNINSTGDNTDTGSILSNDVTISTGGVDVSIQYYPATYFITLDRVLNSPISPGIYTYQINYPTGIGGSVATVTGDCATPNPAHYDLFHRYPGGGNLPGIYTGFGATNTTGLAVSVSDIIGLGPDGQCLVMRKITAGTPEMQNFANWFSYYRKRHLALRGGVVTAFKNSLGIRAGVYAINNSVTALLPPLEITMLGSTNQNNFFSKIYSINGNGGGTPNRAALDTIGRKYQIPVGNTDALVLPETQGGNCQKHFVIQFTDGFSTITNEGVGNVDGTAGAPYQDGYSNTLADIAMQYYQNNLQPGMAFSKVPVPTVCPAPTSCSSSTCLSVSTIKPEADCNRNPHMNTITVGIGAYGTIFNSPIVLNSSGEPLYQKVVDAYSNPLVWPDVTTDRDPRQIDDLYHAAVNGRGEMLNARTPAELTTVMQKALQSVFAQVGVASAVTFNTSRLTAANQVFLSLFNTYDWSGDVRSYDLTALTNSVLQGAAAPSPQWSAAGMLDVRTTDRVILTYNSGGIPFRWSNLSVNQQNDLRTNPTGAIDNDAVAQARLNFLRGARTNEGSGYNFRIRGSRLGDIVYSNAIYVPSPATGEPDMIYVGANDGMLHGFNADTGEELLAYIPGNLYSTDATSGLHYLTDPSYQHRFYVDLSPVVATYGSKTILIGGERAGGKGYFALDISNPSTFSESGASNIVLWEFSSINDVDLGYTFSTPTIARLNNGDWGVIFGNGYNSANGESKLFIVYLNADGTIKGTPLKIGTSSGTPVSPSGLSTPGVIDLNFDLTADRVYAGDVLGKLWAFDISKSSVASWGSAYSSGSNPAPLFTASTNQPITTEPVIAKNPLISDTNANDPNVLILFGTGQYLTAGDASTVDQQSFYGIWDNGKERSSPGIPLTRSNLVAQILTPSADGNSRAVTTVNNVPYSPPATSTTRYGWYLDLPTSGERVITTAAVRVNTVFFNTMIPSTDKCSYGGAGWLMAIDLSTGGGTVDTGNNAKAVVDTNGDDTIDENDLCYASGSSLVCPSSIGSIQLPPTGSTIVASSGQKFSDSGGNSLGLPAQSSFTTNYQYTPGTKTVDGSTINIRTIEEYRAGRLSWQELLGN